MTVKMGTMGTKIVLLLLIMTIVFTPQAEAKPQYLAALKFVYGDGSCTNCHTDPNGGKSLTDYGSKFSAQPIHSKDSVMALRAIGEPTSATPVTTSIATIITPVATEITPVATEITPVVTVPIVTTTTPIVTDTVVATIVPTVDNNNKSKAEEKAEEESEKGETTERSPGFGIIFTIGTVWIMYILRRHKKRK